MSTTAIEWATHVWNPFTGCDRVSPGCAHCYAAETAKGNQRKELGRQRIAIEQGKPLPLLRYQNDGDPRSSGPGFKFTIHRDRLEKPPRFPAGARVFVNSMSDVFHEDAPGNAIYRLLEGCRAQPHANFLILTKRAERMHDLLNEWAEREVAMAPGMPWWKPPVNVWLGVSIENRRFVRRAELLARTPASVRFISAEPLLGPLIPEVIIAHATNATSDGDWTSQTEYRWSDGYTGPGLRFYEDGRHAFDWLICGAESGSERRRFDLDWVRDLRNACVHEGVAFFFKQGSAHRPGQHRELDGRTWDQLPPAAFRHLPEGRALAGASE